MQVEIVDFKEPKDGQLTVTKIKWQQKSEFELKELLQQRFSPYGLLHWIKVNLDSSKDDGECMYYAYVNFYSAIAAQRALKAFGQGLIIEGQRCRIVHKKRDLKLRDRLLYINQCEDLANYYLGFNHWQSQILYHQKESENHLGDKLTYATAVKLVFDGQEGGESISVEGVGLSQIEYSGRPEEKMHKLAMGQKASKNAAVVNAFAKTVLILVHNPSKPVKATIKIDHQVADPFYYNAIWCSTDKPILENVNELDQEPDLEK